jgi:hypothetical protein
VLHAGSIPSVVSSPSVCSRLDWLPTYVLAAVGEEIDLLVGLHTLGLKQLEQATLGLLNPGKAPSRELLFALLIPFKGQETFAGNHLELSLLPLPAPSPRALEASSAAG